MKILTTISILIFSLSIFGQKEVDELNMKAFVVVADTSLNYWNLQKEMIQISEAQNLKIDTMGRYYDQKKNLICLPETDSDDIYAGDYFPRRSPVIFLSLEYLSLYQRYTRKNNIGIVAGIFQEQSKADSLLQIIKPNSKAAFIVETTIYMGCLH